MNTKLIVACLAVPALGGSLRGLQDTGCDQLPSCISSYSNGKLMTNIDEIQTVCSKSATCIGAGKAAVTLDSSTKGSCWTVVNGGTITVNPGFAGSLVANRCGGEDTADATLIITKGSSPSSVINEGGTVKATGATVGTLTTEGGDTTAMEVVVTDVTVQGGKATVTATNAVKSGLVQGGALELVADSLDSLTVKGGGATIKASGAAKSVRVQGGKTHLTAKTIETLSVQGGSATVSQAAVSNASTQGGTIDLIEGATVAIYAQAGGMCKKCPAPVNKY